MKASFTAADLPGIERLATLYRFKDGQWKAEADDYRGERPKSLVPDSYYPGRNGVVFAPQGGLRVSALDLSKLLRALMGRGEHDGSRILKEDTVLAMREPQFVVELLKELYATGLGIHLVSPFAGDPSLWTGHSGDASGLHSDMYHEHEERFGLVFATNGVKGDHVRARREATAAVLSYLKADEHQSEQPKAD